MVDAATIRAIKKVMAPVARMAKLTVSRMLTVSANASGNVTMLTGSMFDNETDTDIENFQQYGFASFPLSGSEGIFLAVGGMSDHGVALCVDDPNLRPKDLLPGEVAVYNDKGTEIRLLTDGSVVVTPGGSGFIKLAGESEFMVMADKLQSQLATLVGVYNGHTHPTTIGATGTTPAVQTAPTAASMSSTKVKCI